MHSPCYFCLDFLCSSSLLIGFHCCLWYLYYCCYLCLSLPWFSFFQCVPVLFSLALIVFAHGSDSISLCLVRVGSSSAISAFITGLGRFQLFRLFWYLSPGLLVIIIIIIRVDHFQWTSWIFWYLSLGQLHTAQFHSFLSFWHICLSTLLFYPTALHLAGMQSVLSWGNIFIIINISLGNFLAPFYVENWIKIPSSTLSLSFWHIVVVRNSSTSGGNASREVNGLVYWIYQVCEHELHIFVSRIW